MRRRSTHERRWLLGDQVQFVFALTALAVVVACFAIAFAKVALS